MPILRMQCSFGGDSPLARDRFVITPHFNDQGVGSDADALATDLANELGSWCTGLGSTREVTVKSYDAQGTVPVAPNGEHQVNIGTYPASTCPREVAICLSFFSGFNRPRTRGRLYIPLPVLKFIPNTARPDPAVQNAAATLVPIFTGLGGPDVDWCVYSRLDDQARSVTNWYVDNEWDTMRSRGMRPTTRVAGTASE